MSGSQPKSSPAPIQTPTPVVKEDPNKKIRRGYNSPNVLTGPQGSKLGQAETAKNKLGL